MVIMDQEFMVLVLDASARCHGRGAAAAFSTGGFATVPVDCATNLNPGRSSHGTRRLPASASALKLEVTVTATQAATAATGTDSNPASDRLGPG
jgi:hypothetical protein